MLLVHSMHVPVNERWQTSYCLRVFVNVETPEERRAIWYWIDDQEFFVHQFNGWADEYFFEQIDHFLLLKMSFTGVKYNIPYFQSPRFEHALETIRQKLHPDDGRSNTYELMKREGYFERIKLTPYLESAMLGT